MAGTYEMRIVSPEGNVLQEEIEFCILPGEFGELGILPHHAPLIASLQAGVLRYTKDNSIKRVAISGGFAEVADNAVSVLAETAEPADLIDLERARAAKERAENRLANRSEDTDIKRAEIALRKAVARISAVEGK